MKAAAHNDKRVLLMVSSRLQAIWVGKNDCRLVAARDKDIWRIQEQWGACVQMNCQMLQFYVGPPLSLQMAGYCSLGDILFAESGARGNIIWC